MRKCLRCGAEMKEGYGLFGSDSHWRIIAAEDRKLFPKEIGKLSCAVCPECGHIELYLEDTSGLGKE